MTLQTRIKRMLKRLSSRILERIFQSVDNDDLYEAILKLIGSGKFTDGEAALLISAVLNKTGAMDDRLRVCLIGYIAQKGKFQEPLAVQAINEIARHTYTLDPIARGLTIKSLVALGAFSKEEAVQAISAISANSPLMTVMYTRVRLQMVNKHIMSFIEAKSRN